MTAFIAQGIGLAVSLSIKAAVLFGCGALLVLALRRSSAALRHRAGTWAIWGAALLPLVALLLPAFELPLLPARAVQLGPFVPAATSGSGTEQSESAAPALEVGRQGAFASHLRHGRGAPRPLGGGDAPRSTSTEAGRAAAALPGPTLVARLRRAMGGLRAASTLACLAGLAAGAVWFAGLLLLWTRLAIGLRRVQRLSREAQPADLAFQELAAQASRELQLGAAPARILLHPDVPVPMTAGLRRPVVLLPPGASEWTAARRRVVLLHELAHVRRHDWAQLVSSELALGIWWFHPLAWWLSRSVRRDAEQAADDLVLSAGTRPSDYAEELLGMVRSLRPDACVPRPAMAMAQSAGIEERVRAILDGTRRRSLGVMQGRALGMALGAVLLALAIARPTLARARDSSGDAPTPPLAPLPPLTPLPPLAPAPPATPPLPLAPSAPAAMLAPRAPPASPPRGGLRDGEQARLDSRRARLDAQLAQADRDLRRALASAETETGVKLERLGERISQRVERELRHVGTKLADLDLNSGASFEEDDASAEGDTDLYDRAMRLHERGRYQEAIALFQKAIEDDERVEAASYNIACGYAQLGDVGRAVEWLKKAAEEGEEGEDVAQMVAGDDDFDAIRGDPKLRAALRELRAHRGSQHSQEVRAAERRYQRLAQRAPKGSEPWASIGRELLQAGSYELAAQAYQAAADRSSSPGTFLYNGACALSLKGDKKAALDRLQAAIEQGFNDPRQMKKDDDLDALRDEPRFAELVQLAKDLKLDLEGSIGNFFVNLGPLHIGRSGHGKRHEEAADDVAHYQEMVKKHPNVGRAHYNLGYAQLAARDGAAAEKAFGEALAHGYRKGATLYNLACAQARQKKADAALDSLKKAQEAGFPIGSYLRSDDDLDNLRDDARFQELRQKVRAAERSRDDQDEDDDDDE